MVQVLEANPSFGTLLAQHLGQAGMNLGEGLQKRYENKSAQSFLGKILNPEQDISQSVGNDLTDQKVGSNQPMIAQQPEISKAQLISAATSNNPQIKQAFPAIKAIYDQQEAHKIARQKVLDKEAAQIRQETRQAENAISQKAQEADIGKRNIIREQRQNLRLARDAVQSGDVGAFSLNSFADMFGDAGKRLKTAKGAQLDTATKNLLFENINKVTAKGTNLWLEKVAKSAIPELGKTEGANETLITMAEGAIDVEEKALDIRDNLIQKYRTAGLPVPSDIEKQVNDQLKPFAEKIENKMAYDTRVIYEKEKGVNFLRSLEKVPKGTPLTLEKRDALIKIYNGDKAKAREKAIELGYQIPDPSVLNR